MDAIIYIGFSRNSLYRELSKKEHSKLIRDPLIRGGEEKYERGAKIPEIVHSCGERCTIGALIMTLLSVKAFGKE